MFKNEKVFIKKINEEVHMSRIIASYVWTHKGCSKYDFQDWLRKVLELDEETVMNIYNFAVNGKMELEHLK